MKKNYLLIGILTVSTATLLSVTLKKPGDKKRSTTVTAKEQAAQKPNVIVILADDLGYHDLSSFGNDVLKTPNIDSLGTEGTRFTQAYSSAPICSPSRAGLVTGRYQQRFGFEFLVPQNEGVKPTPEQVQQFVASAAKTGGSVEKLPISQDEFLNIKKGLPESEVSIGQLFKQNGYQTAIIGKWHLGETDGFQPQKRGFDYHYGFYSGLTLYAYPNTPGIVDYHLPWALSERVAWTREGSNRIVRNDKPVVDDKEFLTDRLADEAISYIESNKTKPFFLYLPFNAPHDPFQAKKSDFDKYASVKDSTVRVYYGMITGLDNAIGRIHRKLKALGLDKNTIIVFTSDNGGATYTRATDNYPLRGGKLSHFEGGVNIPFFIKYPGKVPAGQVYKLPVSNLDIFSTVAAAANISLPKGVEYDGTNLLPYVNGSNKARPHDVLFWRNGYSKAVRKGDWKLYINTRNNKQLLFDLSKDRSETSDLSAQHPDLVKELSAALQVWESKVKTPTWPNTFNSSITINGENYFFPI
ncbi:sulfatase [Solitalea longa]|uniref:Sulfatase n=1 Tax=Solitalea longa TaxID=2079460 RepID=A0A2S5A3B3_9SPHI|nr:sulfatase [Solitalea longa]POY36603.1 sulfatase [Solitalea longa]